MLGGRDAHVKLAAIAIGREKSPTPLLILALTIVNRPWLLKKSFELNSQK